MGYKKNRKKQAVISILPWRMTAFFLAVGVTAFLYLWLSNQCEALGVEIRKLEDQKAEIRKRVVNEEYRLANMKTPENVDRLLRQFGIQMGLPEPGQVVLVRSRDEARTVHVAAGTRVSRGGQRPFIHD